MPQRATSFTSNTLLDCRQQQGEGTGPTLKIKVGGTQVWTKQIDLSTEDQPWDRACGGASHGYGDKRVEFSVPANTGGHVELIMEVKDRNIHVVGEGIQCAEATATPTPAPTHRPTMEPTATHWPTMEPTTTPTPEPTT